jgi:predicted metal-dependent hydrolase
MQEQPEKSLIKGIDEFNSREFFACHETLEHLWRSYGTDVDRPDRQCIQGIIQIAVGYYHFGRGNLVGALKLLTRGLERVKRFQPSCFGLNTASFCEQVSLDWHRLQSAKPGDQIELSIPRIERILD